MQQECKWQDHNHNQYDFSGLEKSDYWEVKGDQVDSGIFSLAYIFNFCGKHQTKCYGTPGAYQALDVMGSITDTCNLLGKSDQQIISVIGEHDGLQIKYPMGETCGVSENPADIGKPKSIQFNIMCGKIASNWKVLPINSNDVTSCNVQLSITHPTGCYQGQFSGLFSTLSKIILYIFVGFILYLVIGIIYNIKINKIYGINSVPQYELIKTFPSSFVRCLRISYRITINKYKQMANVLKLKKHPYLDQDYGDL